LENAQVTENGAGWLLVTAAQNIIRHYRLNKPRDIINSSNKVYNFFAFVSLGYYYDFHAHCH